MAPNATLKRFPFHPFIVNENLKDNNQDIKILSWISFTKIYSSLDTDYVSSKAFQSKFKDYAKNSSSVVHLNIRSLSKSSESFKEVYNLLSFKFSIVCFPERWSKDGNVNENSLYQFVITILPLHFSSWETWMHWFK